MTQKSESPLRELCRDVWAVPDPGSERERRERIASHVLGVQKRLSARSERHRRLRVMVALAAIVGAACAVVLFSRSEIVLTASQSPRLGLDAVRLVAGHASRRSGADLAPLGYGPLDVSSEPVLVTREAETAEFRLSSDTAVNVAPASEVGIVPRQATALGFEERVRLRAGSVALVVPKLGVRNKVFVETRDALIEVHGTQFSVRVVERPPLAAFTEVEVREGRVSVRSGSTSLFLAAGESWSSNDASSRDAKPSSRVDTPAAPLPAPEVRAAPVTARRVATTPERASATASELAAQNRLLEAAELAQKSGMPGLALARFDALITRYPDSELAHNARVARFRILSDLGRHEDAVIAARAYLDRYPDGFARAEARRLIGSAPTPVP